MNAFIPGLVTLHDLETYEDEILISPGGISSYFTPLELLNVNAAEYLSPVLFPKNGQVDQWSQPGLYLSDYLGELSAAELGSADNTHLTNVANPLDPEFPVFL